VRPSVSSIEGRKITQLRAEHHLDVNDSGVAVAGKIVDRFRSVPGRTQNVNARCVCTYNVAGSVEVAAVE